MLPATYMMIAVSLILIAGFLLMNLNNPVYGLGQSTKDAAKYLVEGGLALIEEWNDDRPALPTSPSRNLAIDELRSSMPNTPLLHHNSLAEDVQAHAPEQPPEPAATHPVRVPANPAATHPVRVPANPVATHPVRVLVGAHELRPEGSHAQHITDMRSADGDGTAARGGQRASDAADSDEGTHSLRRLFGAHMPTAFRPQDQSTAFGPSAQGSRQPGSQGPTNAPLGSALAAGVNGSALPQNRDSFDAEHELFFGNRGMHQEPAPPLSDGAGSAPVSVAAPGASSMSSGQAGVAPGNASLPSSASDQPLVSNR
jgi:hypothetical protein